MASGERVARFAELDRLIAEDQEFAGIEPKPAKPPRVRKWVRKKTGRARTILVTLTKPFSEWCAILHVSPQTVSDRMRKGMTRERALLTPDKRSADRQFGDKAIYVTVGGVRRPYTEWCKILNVHVSTITARMQAGMTREEALLAPDRRGVVKSQQSLARTATLGGGQGIGERI